MTDEAVQRDLGRMEAQITALISQVKALNEKVGAMDKTLSEARGGWRTLMWIGGVAGTVGAGLSWLVSHFPTIRIGG